MKWSYLAELEIGKHLSPEDSCFTTYPVYSSLEYYFDDSDTLKHTIIAQHSLFYSISVYFGASKASKSTTADHIMYIVAATGYTQLRVTLFNSTARSMDRIYFTPTPKARPAILSDWMMGELFVHLGELLRRFVYLDSHLLRRLQ
eukprot:gene34496-44578_t